MFWGEGCRPTTTAITSSPPLNPPLTPPHTHTHTHTRTHKNTPTQVLVQTPSKNYTSGDYECLLQDLGLHDAVPIFRHVFPQYLATLVPPGVSCCLVG